MAPQGSFQHEKREAHALLIGVGLIVCVALYFVGRVFFLQHQAKKIATQALPSDTLAKKETGSITPATVRQKLLNREPVVFIDLRSKELFEAEHIPNSLSLSTSAFNHFVPKANDILVIVYSVGDTETYAAAKSIIESRALTAFFLEGGFEGWKQTSNQTISAGDPNSFLDQSKVTYISSTELLSLLRDPTANVFLLDVQAASTFERVHIKNATNIPLPELEKRLAEVPSDKPIVVYGENELISFQAAVRLADLNIFAAKALSGNNNLLGASGLPLEPPLK